MNGTTLLTTDEATRICQRKPCSFYLTAAITLLLIGCESEASKDPIPTLPDAYKNTPASLHASSLLQLSTLQQPPQNLDSDENLNASNSTPVSDKIASETEEDSVPIDNASIPNSESAAGPFDRIAAFPYAEGFGVNTPAGRGGKICRVKNTDDSGEHSLRSCIEMSGPRSVIFDIAGTINLKTPLVIKNPFISIYGQTAPLAGIMVTITPEVEGPVMQVKSHDVLVQHIRFRAGASRNPSCCRDSVSIGATEPNTVYNVVFDHNSFSWGTDEIVDIWHDAHDVTISWSIISESLHDSTNKSGKAGRGLLIASEKGHSISIHHNYFATVYQRTPLIGTPGVVDVSNNLVYHWLSRGAGVDSIHGVMKTNFVKNKFIAKTQGINKQRTNLNWFDITLNRTNFDLEVYLEGNISNIRTNSDDPEWKLVGTGYKETYDPALGWLVPSRNLAPYVTEFAAENLEEYILPYVGAVLPARDEVDSRAVNNLETGEGIMANCVAAEDPPYDTRCANNYGGWPYYPDSSADYETVSRRLDTDNDGIPDTWEMKNWLNPLQEDSLTDYNENGFTALEEWIYSLGSGE